MKRNKPNRWVIRVGAPDLSNSYWKGNPHTGLDQSTPMWWGQSVRSDGTVVDEPRIYATKQEAQDQLKRLIADDWGKYELSICKFNPRKSKP